MDLTTLSLVKLETLAAEIAVEIRNRKATELQQIECTFSTHGMYDPRKHGAAYVAKIFFDENGKLQREFLNNVNRIYDSKHRCYEASWKTTLSFGTRIEARLSESSWKNESRQYYIVESSGLRSASRDEVMKQ